METTLAYSLFRMHRRKLRVKSYFALVLVGSGILIILSIAHVSLKQLHITQLTKTPNDPKCTCTIVENRENLHVDRVNQTNTTHAATNNIRRLIESSSKSSNVQNNTKNIQTTVDPLRDVRNQLFRKTAIGRQEKKNSSALYPDSIVKKGQLGISVDRDTISERSEKPFTNKSEVRFVQVNKMRQATTKEKRLVNQLLNKIVNAKLETGSSLLNLSNRNTSNGQSYIINHNKVSDSLIKLYSTENRWSAVPVAQETTKHFKTTVDTLHHENPLNETIMYKRSQKRNLSNHGHPGMEYNIANRQLSNNSHLDQFNGLADTSTHDKIETTFPIRPQTSQNVKTTIGISTDFEKHQDLQFLEKSAFNIRQNRNDGDHISTNAIINGHIKYNMDHGKFDRLPEKYEHDQIEIKVPLLSETTTTVKTTVFKLENISSIVFVRSNATRVDDPTEHINRPKLSEVLTKTSIQRTRDLTVPIVQETTQKFKTTAAAPVNKKIPKESQFAKQIANDTFKYGRPSHRHLRNTAANSGQIKNIKTDKFSNRLVELSSESKTDSNVSIIHKNVTKGKLFQPNKTPYEGITKRFKILLPVKTVYKRTMDTSMNKNNLPDSRPFVNSEKHAKGMLYGSINTWSGFNFRANALTFKQTNLVPKRDNNVNPNSNIPVRNDTCNACFQNNFPIILNPKNICNASSIIDILILIESASSERVKREQIRRTWGSNCNHTNSTIKCVFVIGNFRNRSARNNTKQLSSRRFGSFIITQRELEMEGNLHNDIVQFDFADSYGNLTYKTLSGLKWTATFCAAAKYVMKTDTDMFVNTYLLPILVNQTPKTLFIGGYCWGQSSPHRDTSSKWFVSYNQFRHHLFPAMCSGTGYILSADLVCLILKQSPNIPFFYLEDVYISLCLKGTGIKPRRLSGFFNEDEQFEACHYKTEVITSHLMNPEMLQQYWNDVRSCNNTVLPNNVYKEIPYPYIYD